MAIQTLVQIEAISQHPIQRQIFKNLGLYLNYTYADTDTEGVLDRSDLDKIPLPGAAKNTFNASLDYETDKFNVRVSYNYTDGYIDEFAHVK